MVGRYERALKDPLDASRLLIRAAGIADPTIDQEATALLVARFLLSSLPRL